MYFCRNRNTVNLLYNLGIYAAHLVLKIIALFNHKIKLGVLGRAETFNILEKGILKTDKTLWFHCSSLGEYEQGLPVFKALRQDYPNHKIVLSFFSPSGYEIRKHTDIADIVVYLPLDTKQNATQFLNLIHPELTVFVKYDIWPNYLNIIKKRQHKAILISATFRKQQSYFKWYGKQMKTALQAFDHIFVQNESSKTLINSIGFNNITVAGDTRFDRVANQLEQNNVLDFISEFKNNQLCIVVGSSWPEDEAQLIQFINNTPHKNVKYIIAPHNIKSGQIANMVSNLKVKTVLFSEKEGKNLSEYSVFIIDTIGLLSKIYSYADIAYVGGAMGNTGLHNVLEPAVFGVPIIIGKHHEKFPEAAQMITNGGLFSITNTNELDNILTTLIENDTKREKTGELNSTFIKKNEGAVIQILNYTRK